MVKYDFKKISERYIILLDRKLGERSLGEKLNFYHALLEVFSDGPEVIKEVRGLCARKVSQLEESTKSFVGC